MLGWEGADAWTLEMFYIALVKAILLYNSEMWVIYPHIRKTMGGFHHWVV